MHRLRKILAHRLVPAIVLLVVFAISSFFLSSFTEASHVPLPPPEVSSPNLVEPNIPDVQEGIDSPINVTPNFTAPPIPTPTHPPEPPEPECDFTTATGEPINYEYGEPIPESEPVEDDYFADTVFVGDSRTEGFKLYSGLKTADILAAKCINVDNIYRESVISNGNGEYVSIIDALSWKPYSKVYIMLGINELGFDSDTFSELYSKLIDNIREIQPSAEIYLQAIIPVSKIKDESGSIYTNERICVFNRELSKLASQKEVFYIDTYSAFCNEEGYLPDDASFDGVHLIKDYCIQWLDYLKTHTALPIQGTESFSQDTGVTLEEIKKYMEG